MTGEATLVVGGGSQTHASSRWGNYSSMDVDPKDDCTFWYTTEYYEATSAAGWKTRVSSFKQPSCGVVAEKVYEYAAKLVCGLQKDPQGMRLTRGFYGTAINIHNPNRDAVAFRKKLALTFPPEEQKPGKILPIAEDKLESDEALEVDCLDIQRRLFPNGFPEAYIKGFVVIQSKQSLDVTAVYTTASLDREGQVTTQSGIDVEQIRERIIEPEKPRLPDLKVQSISRPQVSCPGGQGTCVTVVSVKIANVGAGEAGAFNVRTVFDPVQSVVVNQAVPGLVVGEQTLTVTTPPGGNCFDPDCTICVTVDSGNTVTESDEGNNNLCVTTPG
jgi:hypothetical protein